MSRLSEHTDRATHAKPETIVAPGVVIRGDIEGETALHVQGRVIGRIAVSDLTLEADAQVDGSVTAEAVTVSGRMIGPVEAQTVHLTATASVEGDVTCKSIQIDPGARFTGRCISDELHQERVASIHRLSTDGPPAEDETQQLLSLAARLRRIAV